MCYSLEKEALENSLFDVQRQLAQLEARREQLEADSQALLLAKEALTGTRVWVRGLCAALEQWILESSRP